MGTHPIFESDFDCLTEWRSVFGKSRWARETMSSSFPTGRRLALDSSSQVDGQIVIKRDWMFRLVGEETFTIGPKKQKAKVRIEAVDGFTYTYKLLVGNRELEKFARDSVKNLAIWKIHMSSGEEVRKLEWRWKKIRSTSGLAERRLKLSPDSQKSDPNKFSPFKIKKLRF